MREWDFMKIRDSIVGQWPTQSLILTAIIIPAWNNTEQAKQCSPIQIRVSDSSRKITNENI